MMNAEEIMTKRQLLEENARLRSQLEIVCQYANAVDQKLADAREEIQKKSPLIRPLWRVLHGR